LATKEFWIQIENNPWDVSPNDIDRYTGQKIEEITGKAPVEKELYSPVTKKKVKRKMFFPVLGDALILRRYTENWAQPDDRKVNPWDINEPDPSDNGTMGTIPGPVIECDVGDTVIVHFRNMDMRIDSDGNLLNIHERAHSLHPHGFVFETKYDGAFPLSPPDRSQPVGTAEADLWKLVGVTELKKGDRIPGPAKAGGVGGTFTYTWNTFSWPTTAGVWLYHDHSICDHHNVGYGAIGIIVINNPNDPNYMPVQDLPDGLLTNSPIEMKCFPFPSPVPTTLPHDVNKYLGPHPPADLEQNADKWRIDRGPLRLELSDDDKTITQICIRRYRNPPKNALYLQLYHEMPGVFMLINGRKFMGNTPTLIAGPETKMRFGVVGMNDMVFHTFHLHGHRWVIPGPAGNNPGGGNGSEAIQNSPLVNAASQFEDTKIFGPANSFSFTINQGTFMGAPVDAALGEWHMHCHVLGHMMSTTGGGMMGSLLVVQGGELALGLPTGEHCPSDSGGGHEAGGHKAGGTETDEDEVQLNATVRSTDMCQWKDDVTGNPITKIKVGGTVTWLEEGCSNHTVVSDNVAPFDTLSPKLDDPVPTPPNPGFTREFKTVGKFGYHCGVHSGNPVNETGMWGIVEVVE
jgi:FtsP/CotA-like multicopper oxidase with cupredoxin domain/plastocyanin